MKLGSLSLIIRNKKSGQSMHALTKTKLSKGSLTKHGYLSDTVYTRYLLHKR